MNFRTTVLLPALVLTLLAGQAGAQSNPIISNLTAARQGLTRAWFTQVQLDRSRSRITYVMHHDGTLFVQTTHSMVHAIDAETGKTQWAMQIGRREHPSMAPAANQEVVAVVNGSRVYVVDRKTGHYKWDRQVGSGPGAGPALTDDRVFIPMINGIVEGYELEHPNSPPWIYASAGRALIPPVTTKDSVFWPTDRGHLYVSRAVNPGVRFRIETRDAIVSTPAYRRPHIFAASRDGYVYAVHEQSGNQLWRFSVGDPVSESPIVIGERLFVCGDYGGMHCISTKSGEEVWWAPRVSKFLAASGQHVYAADHVGRLIILNGNNGARVGTLPIYNQSFMLSNSQTDRIYVASDTGLLQCLHDAAQIEPLKHWAPDTGEDEEAEEAPEAKAKPKSAKDDDDLFGGDDPFGGDDDPAMEKEDENPFAGGDDDPFGGDDPAMEKEDENPFAGGDEDPFGGGGGGAADENPFGGGDDPAMEKEDDNPFAGDDDPFN